MGPDDKTTEIELVSRRSTDLQKNNIVHVNFGQRRASARSWGQRSDTPSRINASSPAAHRTVDRLSPWIIRLVALLCVLLLSVLVL